MMYDVIVIGKGPAGAQAAIYLARAGFKTLVIYKDDGALIKAEVIDNYYGFVEAISGKELLDRGVKQAKQYGVEFVQDEVVLFQYDMDNNVEVKTVNTTYSSSYVIIAAGTSRKTINVPGLKKLEGKGVSYCVTCDGFFFRNKKTALLGYTAYAEHELNDLLMFTQDITLLTNGKALEFDASKYPEMKIIDQPIASLTGDEILEAVQFKNGESQQFDGIFIAYGAADASAFCSKSGIATDKSRIVVDEDMMTGMDRIYAAGDCTGTYLQVAVAVAEGALAAKSVISRLKEDARQKKQNA